MLEYCNSLVNLKLSLDLSNCPLTHESANFVINELAEVKDHQVLTFSNETYEALIESEIKSAEAKNWRIINIK